MNSLFFLLLPPSPSSTPLYQEKEILKGPIHTTIGVYPNTDRGLWKINGVDASRLEKHIQYNKEWRWGRALFVDGTCVYPGNVRREDIDRIEAELKEKPIVIQKDTAPYR